MRRSVVLLNQQRSHVFEGFTGFSLSSINPNHHLLARRLASSVTPRQLLYDQQLIGLKSEAEELQRKNCVSEN